MSRTGSETMSAFKVEQLEALLAELQNEVEELKSKDLAMPGMSHDMDATPSMYKELQMKIEKLEGNLGVDKVVLTDVGDKVLVTVQTPLGTVPITVPHTANTGSKTGGRPALDHSLLGSNQGMNGVDPPSHASTVVPPITNIKGGAPAGMTTEQLQDFKKQTLQINQLQQKIKDLESRLQEANNLIKKGEEVTHDITTKESEDVKEIYLYLDEINTTMSQKIAAQRVEMEKLSGDTPQPINYDPFNYGDAYAGDVVDFEARKRIVEMDLLFQSLQIAMNGMKDSVREGPTVDLGYKVVRLDQLVEATGFGHAIRTGELTTDNGLLVNQAATIDPPERRYPRKEAFQTDEEKEYQWSVTDSIMQTMYRLEMELGQLQKIGMDTPSTSTKEMDELLTQLKQVAASNPTADHENIMFMVERECKQFMAKRISSSATLQTPTDANRGPSARVEIQTETATNESLMQGLKDQLRDLEIHVDMLFKTQHGRHHRPEHPMASFNPHSCKHINSFYKNPVKLRYLLQRVFRSQRAHDAYAHMRMPRLVGVGYLKPWPKINVTFAADQKKEEQDKDTDAVASHDALTASTLREITRVDQVARFVEPQR